MKSVLKVAGFGVLFCICLGFVTTNTLAQAKKSVSDLADGDWSLQFEIGPHFDLQSFEGTTLSLKRFTGDRTAWRAGFSFNLDDRDDDHTGFSSNLNVPAETIDDNAFSISAVIHRVLYTAPKSKTALFFGVGPAGTYAHSQLKQRRDYPDGRFLLEERENDSWSAGLSAVMGVEWFLRKNLSLLAEYGTLIKYTHNKRTTTFINNDPLRSQITQEEIVSKRFAINDQAVKFGISLYF